MTKIEITDEYAEAFDLMENSDLSLFVTGRAGTGKSTLVNHFRNKTKKNVVVLAPTGVAAINVHGQTIHSFFKFKPNITPDTVKKQYSRRRKIYEELDTIVIDEVSMVRADLLDCVDRSLRLQRSDQRPFGGAQIIFVGDLYQLPPVVRNEDSALFETHYQSPYFFDSFSFQEIPVKRISLNKVYRQEDKDFITILDAIREGNIAESLIHMINTRHINQYIINPSESRIYLTTTNALADNINHNRLSQIKTESSSFTGHISGQFPEDRLPTALTLQLKIGAQVMLLNNDPEGRWVNGDIGAVTEINRDEDYEPMDDESQEFAIKVQITGKRIHLIPLYTWEVIKFKFNEETEKIESKTIGSFTQYPLKLAWAVTIHKAQGKTFDKILIDFGRGTFAHGQAYVALSRCTSLEGIILKKPLEPHHIILDKRIGEFMRN